MHPLQTNIGIAEGLVRAPERNWDGIEDNLYGFALKRTLTISAIDLGLFDAAQYRNANIQLVKNGQAKTERYDDEMLLEQPELLSTALEALRQTGTEALNDLCDDLGLSPVYIAY